MPVYATFQNIIFDIRCSKCKRSYDPVYFTQHGMVYKTFNECRARARRRHIPRVSITYFDTDGDYAVSAVLALSSSAAASSTSSADYFVAEPDPEPEPESP